MAQARPDLVALEVLVGIAEHGSLGAAARAIGMAQPNASRAVSRLERQLDLTLVVRSPRGSDLSPEGTVVLEWAREALEAVDRVVIGGQALAMRRRSQLTVSASMTVAEYLVPSWLADVRREHPEVQVNLEVANSVDVLAAVTSGRVDLGFIESPSVPRGVGSTTVGEDRMVVVVHPRHPWARRRRPLPLIELAATPLIVREPGSGTRETLERALRRAGLTPAPPAFELASNAAVKVSAASGLAPAVLSELAVAASVRGGDLVEVALEGPPISRRLRAVWLAPPTGPAKALVQRAAR